MLSLGLAMFDCMPRKCIGLLLLCLSRSLLNVPEITDMIVLAIVFIFLQTENIMILFQKFHPTGTGEAAKLDNKVVSNHGSDADSEIEDKFIKPSSMPVKVHQTVRPTKHLLVIECTRLFNFIFCDERTYVYLSLWRKKFIKIKRMNIITKAKTKYNYRIIIDDNVCVVTVFKNS